MRSRAEAGAWEESTVLRWRTACQRGTRKSQRRNLYSEVRGNLKGGHCGSFSTGFRGGPGGQRASMINEECRELKLCRAHIKPFKNVSLFLSLWPNMSWCPQSHWWAALLLEHFLCVLYTHTRTRLYPLPQFGLHVCFLCRPQPPRCWNSALVTCASSPWNGRQ